MLFLKLFCLFYALCREDMLFQIHFCRVIEPLLDGIQQLGDAGIQFVEGNGNLLTVVAPDCHAGIVLNITRTDLKAKRNTFHFILCTFPSQAVVRKISFSADTQRRYFLKKFFCFRCDTGFMGSNRNDDHLDRGDFGRENQSVIVPMGHNNRTDHACSRAPGSLERILEGVVTSRKGDIICTGEFIAEVMRCGTLKSFVVFHQALYRVGCFCTGKFFLLGFSAADYRNGQHFFKEVGIAIELLLSFSFCFLGGFMDGVTFLPPEFTGTKERSRSFLPADDRAPLIVQHWEFAVGMQDLRPVITEHSLRSRTESKSLFKLFAAAHSDPCYLRCKSVDEFSFFFEKAFAFLPERVVAVDLYERQ